MEHFYRTMEGSVRSGIGDAAQWIRRLAPHYERLTGELLFPGTLNVLLSKEWGVPDGSLCLRGDDYGGHVSIHIVPCRFMGEPAWVLRTAANDEGRGDHPRTVVEIASPHHLRQRFGLRDGDMVEVDLQDGGQ